MAERSMAVVLKTTVGETPPGVRIPLPPPTIMANILTCSYLFASSSTYPTFIPTLNRAGLARVHVRSVVITARKRWHR